MKKKLWINQNNKLVKYEKNDLFILAKQISTIQAGLIKQYKFYYQTGFSARFDKQDGDEQVLDEIEFSNNIKTLQNKTESDNDKIDYRSQ